MSYKKCFGFRLLEKSNASEFASASSFFFKVLPLPQKFNRFPFCFHIPGYNHSDTERFRLHVFYQAGPPMIKLLRT